MKMIDRIVPIEAQAFLVLAKKMRGQGSLEYIMMLSAASIVILIALAMIVKLKGSVVGSITVNGTNMSVGQAISSQLSGLTKGA
jgi:hypothetical protein